MIPIESGKDYSVIPVRMESINNRYVVVFLWGLFSSIQPLGSLAISLSEMAAFGYFLYHLFTLNIRFKKNHSIFFLCLFLWFFGIFFTDLFNDISSVETVKQLGTVVILGVCLYVSFRIFSLNTNLIIIFIGGYALSGLIELFLIYSKSHSAVIDAGFMTQAIYMSTYGVYSIVSFVSLILGFLLYKKQFWMFFLLSIVCSLFFLYDGSRNLFLVFISVPIMILFSRFLFKIGGRKFSVILLPFFLIVSLFAAYTTYSSMAENGYLGDAQKAKYETQFTSVNETKLSIGSAREGFIYSLYIIYHNKLFGCGSNCLADYETARSFDEMFNTNVVESRSHVPSHSHVLTPIVYAGLFALFFWALVIGLFSRFFLLFFTGKVQYGVSAIIIFLAAQQLWNIFFSPLSGIVMLSSLIAIITQLVIHYRRDRAL